jgi:hypothetical protein
MKKLLVGAFMAFVAVAAPTLARAQTVPVSGLVFNGQNVTSMRFNGDNTITYFFDNGGQFTTPPMDPRLYDAMYKRFAVKNVGED